MHDHAFSGANISPSRAAYIDPTYNGCETRVVIQSAAQSRLETSKKLSFAAAPDRYEVWGSRNEDFMLSDDHVTVQEAAEYLRISIATVYRLLRAGKLTAVKVKPPGAKGSLRVSRKLVFEFSDGHSKAASLEQDPPPTVTSGS